jgi:uncharacterized protein (DUF849 family)
METEHTKTLPVVQVTVNGPFGHDRHPRVPITCDEIRRDVAACTRAGARSFHIHTRDAAGAESLSPDDVNRMVAAARRGAEEARSRVEIGLTTGAWIVPDLGTRLAAIRGWEGVNCAKVNVSEEGFEHVMATMLEAGVGVDVGIWAMEDVRRFERSGFSPLVARVSVELDTGPPYSLSGDPTAHASEIHAALDDIGVTVPRLEHGGEEWTWPLVEDAFRRGWATRVGFEDSVFLPDGSMAEDNAALVSAAVQLRDSMAARPPQ